MCVPAADSKVNNPGRPSSRLRFAFDVTSLPYLPRLRYASLLASISPGHLKRGGRGRAYRIPERPAELSVTTSRLQLHSRMVCSPDFSSVLPPSDQTTSDGFLKTLAVRMLSHRYDPTTLSPSVPTAQASNLTILPLGRPHECLFRSIVAI